MSAMDAVRNAERLLDDGKGVTETAEITGLPRWQVEQVALKLRAEGPRLTVEEMLGRAESTGSKRLVTAAKKARAAVENVRDRLSAHEQAETARKKATEAREMALAEVRAAEDALRTAREKARKIGVGGGVRQPKVSDGTARKSRTWTPEQRAAQSERMRETLAKARAAKNAKRAAS